MIKLLIAMGGPMVRAGAETMVMRYIRELVKYKKFDISILVHAEEGEMGDYDQEIAKLGIKIYRVSRRGKHPLLYSKNLESFFSTHRFDIVHCNMDVACGIFLSAAQKANVPVRIAHSHLTTYQATNPIKKIGGYLSKKKIPAVATHRFACSKKAGDWLFDGLDYTIINNAIDLQEYRDTTYRGEYRNELGISNQELVIGHIGRFCEQKNHNYILKICCCLKQKKLNFKVILVGTGPMFHDIKSKAVDLGINDNIIFTGVSDEIPKLMQIFDVFIMPSLFEGLPVTGIEAQASGLPCLFSDRITPEVCLTKNAKILSLDNINEWVNILQTKKFERNTSEAQEALRKNGYSISEEAAKLSNLYVNMLG